MNVIPCTTWIKRGVAAAIPDKVKLTPKELEEIIKQTQSELQNSEDDSDEERTKNVSRVEKREKNTNSATPCNDSMDFDEYNFKKYDEESGNIHCNIGNIALFDEDGKDPFITVGNDDDDSEKEDDIIKPSDNLVLLGRVDGDASILEVFVYNEVEGSFYCHHDMLLGSFPLCIEWLDFDPTDSKPGNLCAIGNMSPIIEVWDIDLIDCLEPAYKLGRKPNKRKNQKRIGHKDAVLDLAWNRNYTHILASGSVDQTVLLWDLENGKPVTKFSSFNEKVQALKWHPTETHQLLTGCADKSVRLFDCREENVLRDWKTFGEIERVLWNNFNTNYCIASTNNGYIEYFDVRKNKSIWNIQAHEKEITGLSLSSMCPGLLVSSSNDGVIKVWDIMDNKEPCIIWEKKSNLGELQCLSANPDSPFIFAVGGDNKAHNFQIIDFSIIPEVNTKFKHRTNTQIKFDDQNPTNAVEKNIESEEMMEVTEDMESMLLSTVSSNTGK